MEFLSQSEMTDREENDRDEKEENNTRAQMTKKIQKNINLKGPLKGPLNQA